VKKYLEEKNLHLKALLVLDNAPAHPPGLEENFIAEYDFIRVKFLPPQNHSSYRAYGTTLHL
jgi:hypothetical protein